MANKKPRPTPRRQSNDITPESGVTVNVKQMLVALGVVLGAGAAYASIIYTQNSQGADLMTLRKTLELAVSNNQSTTKEQEQKREALGKEFLASNREIAAKVGELGTLLAVQQTQIKSTTETMAKIADQLQQINVRSGARR